MLETWKKSYLQVREKIEQSGRDTRWEFDRKRLFERSDHIAQVCRDICKIAQVYVLQLYTAVGIGEIHSIHKQVSIASIVSPRFGCGGHITSTGSIE